MGGWECWRFMQTGTFQRYAVEFRKSCWLWSHLAIILCLWGEIHWPMPWLAARSPSLCEVRTLTTAGTMLIGVIELKKTIYQRLLWWHLRWKCSKRTYYICIYWKALAWYAGARSTWMKWKEIQLISCQTAIKAIPQVSLSGPFASAQVESKSAIIYLITH